MTIDKKVSAVSRPLEILLDQDEVLAELWRSREQLKDPEQAGKLITHLKSKQYLMSRRDLTMMLGGKNGDYLDQLLVGTGYRPIECSTGEDLDKAINSTSFIAEGWLPRGHVTGNVSSPGLGKTYVTLETVRMITTGQTKWFDGKTTFVQTRTYFVVWCEAEGFQAGLKDRIKQLDIPPDRIIFPFKDPLVDFRLEQHFTDLERAIAYYEPDLVVIDSLRGSHGREEKGSKDMQKIMSMLVSLAKGFDIAIILNHHTNKPAFGQPDLVDINRVRGSSAIAANCRMIWGLEKPDPRDETVRLKVVKSNLASFPEPLGLIINDRGVEWTGAPLGDEEFGQEFPKQTKEDQAVAWLEEFLKDGPRPSTELQAAGQEAGFSAATLRRASDRPNLVKKLPPDKKHNHWRWELDAHLLPIQ